MPHYMTLVQCSLATVSHTLKALQTLTHGTIMAHIIECVCGGWRGNQSVRTEDALRMTGEIQYL